MTGDSGSDYSPDDEEPAITNLDRELAAAGVAEDQRILWGLLVIIGILAAHYLLPSLVPALVVAFVVPSCLFGGLAWVIYRNLRLTREILLRHGLRCPRCGHLPHRLNAQGVYAARKCPRCQARLVLR